MIKGKPEGKFSKEKKKRSVKKDSFYKFHSIRGTRI
jgi:hypothetical protein